MTELINAGSRALVKMRGLVLPWQLYFALILSGFSPCHLFGYYYFFYWRSKIFRTVHLSQNSDMQKYEKGQSQKSKIRGSKVKIVSVSRTYDDFLPLARVTDEA